MGFEFEDKTTPYAACRVVRNSMIALFSVVQGYIIITPDWEIARGMDKERNIYLWYVILAGIEGLLGVFMVLFFQFSDTVKETDIEDKYLDPSDKNSVEYQNAQIKNK